MKINFGIWAMGESATSDETDLDVVIPTFKLEIDERKRKPVLHPSDRVAIPLCVYSITASMFLPVFQSLVYQKVILFFYY